MEFRRRVALVIGNARYDDDAIDDLPNARNDADAIARSLQRIGFVVRSHADLDHTALRRVIDDFTDDLSEGDLALVYYAGHGASLRDTNYLLPVDLALRDLSEIPRRGFALDALLNRMQTHRSTNVVFVDACRSALDARGSNRTRSARRHARHRGPQLGRGLSVVRASIGTLIAFSTAPGEMAADASTGTGDDVINSPFAAALLQHIEEPRDLDLILRDVRREVIASTMSNGRAQVPWSESALVGEVVLTARAGTRPTLPAELAPALVSPVTPPASALPTTATTPPAMPPQQFFFDSVRLPPPGAPTPVGTALPIDTETRGTLVDASLYAPGSQPPELGGHFVAVPLNENGLQGPTLIPNGPRASLAFQVSRPANFTLDAGVRVRHGCTGAGGRFNVTLDFEGGRDLTFAMIFDQSDCMVWGGFSVAVSSHGPALARGVSGRYPSGDWTISIVRRGTDLMLEAGGNWILTVPGRHGLALRGVRVEVDNIQRSWGPHLSRVVLR